MANAFNEFCRLTQVFKVNKQIYEAELAVDCANGVGFVAMNRVSEYIKKYLHVTIYNDDIMDTQKVNESCGAEWVHKSGKKPKGMPKVKRQCALDGDADRLIYFR
jgi:phosphoacetylglucosamine mutase